MIERDVKKAVRTLLTAHKWFHWMPPSNAYGKAGAADIIAVKDGLFLAIETKIGKNLPTPQQRLFLKHVHDAGGYAFMVNEARVGALGSWLVEFDVMAEHRERPSDVDPLTLALSDIPDPPKALR